MKKLRKGLKMAEENPNNQEGQDQKGAIPPVTPPAIPSVEIDSRLYTEDGKFNKEGATEYIKEQKEKEAKYEERVLNLRRKVSDGEALEKPEEYLDGYKPAEKYAKLFDEKAPSKKEVDKLVDTFSKAFHSSALSKQQGVEMSNLLLETLEKYGVIDTRDKEQVEKDEAERISGIKKQLGSNADSIIRENELFINRTDAFDDDTKEQLLALMPRLGAGFIKTIHQLRSVVGESAGKRIPISPAITDNLKPDAELAIEYLDKATTEARRAEIMRLRGEANRPGRLMQSIGK